MPMMQPVIYSRSTNIGGILIRNADRRGRWSHCGLVTPEGTVIEARAFHGVVETPLTEFKRRVSRWEVQGVECPEPDVATAWAREQIGKGYDYLAVFSLAFRASWQDDERWHCAELIEMALTQGGRPRFRRAPWYISPNMSAMVI